MEWEGMEWNGVVEWRIPWFLFYLISCINMWDLSTCWLPGAQYFGWIVHPINGLGQVSREEALLGRQLEMFIFINTSRSIFWVV